MNDYEKKRIKRELNFLWVITVCSAIANILLGLKVLYGIG